jgi:drug/metabolite transporter (DMT)-like permease
VLRAGRAAPSECITVGAPQRPSREANLARTDNPLRGIGIIVASTLFLSCSDVTSKYISTYLPPLEIAWVRFFGFVVILLPLMMARGPMLLRATRPRLQILRGATLAGSSLLFISALPFLPLAEATATGFVAPLFVTGLSIPLLGEKVGLRRLFAACIGFLGVLIVVRPGTSTFHPAALLTLTSALGWALTLIVTRKMSGDDPAETTLTYSALVGFVLLSLFVPLVWITPDLTIFFLACCVAVLSTIGQWMVVLAYRHGDASVLAPFTYTQLIWATGLGYLVFHALPDIWTFVGAGVISVTGVYIAHRERVRRRDSRQR